jgi:carotenoid 1,2-hydratase
MTERRQRDVLRNASSLRIGRSQLHWDNGNLVIYVHEFGAPLPKPVRGCIVVKPLGLTSSSFTLDQQQRHVWHPIAPHCRVEVALEAPELQWNGSGYHDANHGAEPLERAFKSWTWSRAHLRTKTAVFYDVQERDNQEQSMSLTFTDGQVQSVARLPHARLPGTSWGIERHTQSDMGKDAKVLSTLENSPFYARSLLRTSVLGEEADVIHESLNLDRFRSTWVRALLPFRMPRRFF